MRLASEEVKSTLKTWKQIWPNITYRVNKNLQNEKEPEDCIKSVNNNKRWHTENEKVSFINSNLPLLHGKYTVVLGYQKFLFKIQQKSCH